MTEKEFNLKLKTIPNMIKEWLEELGFNGIDNFEFDGGSCFVFNKNEWNKYKTIKFEMQLWDLDCEYNINFEARVDKDFSEQDLEFLLKWWNGKPTISVSLFELIK